ncbi:hypothetical protein BV25DRAFT_1818723 [Artomyces pyxidatus]|uniref:Uncharacterized protein n=1 Tax=Artomyces pyxidatus TaxID=48021 RepID=A0ACB8TIL7_9AGAM|nr:hypothetical protein BV25DRAFT_1818723 [Artomyces pyxidatus]
MYSTLALVSLFAALAPSALAAPPVVPDSPCTISFNGYQLSPTLINPYEVHDVPKLLSTVAELLPDGFAIHRTADGELTPELPGVVPAAVTVTIPSSISATNDFTAVAQIKADDVWSAAQRKTSGVLHHLAGTVERTPLNVFAAYGRPLYVYISVPGFAITQ